MKGPSPLMERPFYLGADNLNASIFIDPEANNVSEPPGPYNLSGRSNVFKMLALTNRVRGTVKMANNSNDLRSVCS